MTKKKVDREPIEYEVKIYECLRIHPDILEDHKMMIGSSLSIIHFQTSFGTTSICLCQFEPNDVLQVGETMVRINSSGVLRGDFSVHNVLLTQALDAKVCQFPGLSINGSCLLSLEVASSIPHWVYLIWGPKTSNQV